MNHLTKREKEILIYLKKEPMISQDELAAKMKISRSATAVHISNLLRKGYILGRGYIFDDRNGVLVIGYTWLEINVQKGGVNQDKIDLSYGGIGYLLTEELLKFRVEPTVITFLGRDGPGEQIYNYLIKKQVNVQHIIRHNSLPTSKKVIFKEAGQIIYTAEETEATRWMAQKVFSAKEEVLRNTKVLLIDGGLPAPEIKYLVTKIKQHNLLSAIVGCPLSWYEQKSLLDCRQLFMVCDWQELREFCGTGDSYEPEAIFPTCAKLLQKGLHALVVTFGEQGLVLATRDEIVFLPNSPLQTIHSNLSLTAGIAAGISAGYGIRLALRRAMGMGAAPSEAPTGSD